MQPDQSASRPEIRVPTAAGRVYAAYGGVYICVALIWLRLVDGVQLTLWDMGGAAVALLGMLIIILSPHFSMVK